MEILHFLVPRLGLVSSDTEKYIWIFIWCILIRIMFGFMSNETTSNFQQDPFFGVGSDILSPRKIGIPVPENVELGAQCFATMQTPSENFLISCGNWENSFQVISLSDGRMVQSIRQHKDVVSCVAGMFNGSERIPNMVTT